MNEKINSSICGSIAKNTIQANVQEQFFSSFDKLDFYNIPYKDLEGELSSPLVKQYLEQHIQINDNIEIFDKKEILNVNLEQISLDLVEIFKNYKRAESNSDIQALHTQTQEKIRTIKPTITKFQKTFQNVFTEEILDTNIHIPHTSRLFNQGRRQLAELLENIQKSEDKAKSLMENETNSHILTLAALGAYYVSSPIISFLAKTFIESRVLLFIVRLLFSFNPIGAVIVIISLVFEIIQYFIVEKEKSELKIKIYEFFCIAYEILQSLSKQNSSLASIINFDAKYSGNKISYTLNDIQIQKYFTTLNLTSSDKALMYTCIIKDAKKQEDTISIETQQVHSSVEFAYSEFPLIKEKTLENKDIITSSAFDHLKNITTQFHNLLLIQTPYFTSSLALDFLLQSQQKDRIILCLSNIIESDNSYYQIQNSLRDVLLANNASQARKTIVFLNVIEEVNKKKFFENFKNQVLGNFTALEAEYNKEHFFKSLFTKSYCKEVKTKLANLENIFYGNDIVKIANYTYGLSQSVFERKEYFEQEHMQKQISQILQAFLHFDSMLCNFLDFKVQKKDNSIDENDLQKLRNTLRNELKRIPLSPNIFYVSHIFNNALFALNPNNELRDFRSFFNEMKEKENFKAYKEILVEGLNINELKELIEFIIPLSEPSLWLNFFSYEDQNDFCIFLLYLFDLDLDGAFIAILQDCKSFKKIIEQIKEDKENEKIELRTTINDTFKDELGKKVIDEIISKAEDLIPPPLKLLLLPFKKPFEDFINELFENLLRQLQNYGNLDSKSLVSKLKENTENKTTNLDPQKDKKPLYEKLLNSINKATNKNMSTKESDSFNSSVKVLDSIFKGKNGKFKNSDITAFLIISFIEFEFPTLKDAELQRGITLFSLGMQSKRDSTYAKWQEKSFFIPKKLSKTLLIADFKHSLLMDNALDAGYSIHNPSRAIYTKNEGLAQEQFKELIKQNSIKESEQYHNKEYFEHYQDSEATQQYKEAYYKLYAYIDLIKDDKYNYKALNTDTLMEQKMNNRPRTDFYENKDFAVSLKRVAEYNYKYYKGDTELKLKPDKKANFDKNYGFKERLLNNFIYNEGFIPTEIDTKEEK